MSTHLPESHKLLNNRLSHAAMVIAEESRRHMDAPDATVTWEALRQIIAGIHANQAIDTTNAGTLIAMSAARANSESDEEIDRLASAWNDQQGQQ